MHNYSRRTLEVIGVCIGLIVVACQPSPAAPAPPSATAVTTASSPAAAKPVTADGAPAASPVASPSGVPAASPAAAVAAKPSDASAPKPVTKPADFPTKPIEIILPFPPGGGFDAQARQLARPLEQLLGQPVVIKNVPGGGLRLGARQFEQSPADGYTLGYFADTNLFASTLVEPAEGFDLTKWTWVAGMRKLPGIVVVQGGGPFKTMQDVLDAASTGQRLRLSNNGLGGSLPLEAVFAEAIGIKNVTHVGGYQGTPEMMTSMIQGDTDVHVLTGPQVALPFIQSGDLRVLATLESQRLSLFPNVPTARELGVPNFEELEGLGTTTSGISAPADTPEDRVRFLEFAVLSALRDPQFMDWARQIGILETEINPLSGAEFRAKKAQEYAFWRKYEGAIRRAIS
jgi:tripartite-type tricarboxylate transporter receptor subunit TctC